ncbi:MULTISPECIES: suppressor of fused domain protein [unclassified Clostridium]|uniref:suppressor of fused domain protein n=1 Tax=unclassified Clostridium TaxID=2614128 RepID=UPI0002979266|nr:MULTISPECIES: suppressor of fused domain protein [unclassified Clostridium]EKQ56081.1 MAG: Suppressor of fused protein (SUFU) [Clostridium sp. Maddingley MBC34-26]
MSYKDYDSYEEDMIEDDGNIVLEHIEKYLGCIDSSVSEIVPGSRVSIDTNIINPSKEKNYFTLVTTGMCEYPMGFSVEDNEYKYAELLIKLPANWKLDQESCKDEENYWPIKMLRLIGHLPHIYEGIINEEVIIPNGQPGGTVTPFKNGTELSRIMICVSEDIPPYVFDDGAQINFYTLVPITESEEELVRKNGSNAVMHMLKSKDIVDLGREYLV